MVRIIHNSIGFKIGTEYDRLTVIGPKFEIPGKTKKRFYVVCQCKCGNVVAVISNSLTSGNTKSCRCKHNEEVRARFRTHGDSYSPLYKLWRGMQDRCYNKNHRCYHLYGGRGISVFQDWIESYEVFRDWALANGYRKGLEIDRENNDGNYTPQNCRFVTHTKNCNNTRSNIRLTAWGETKTMAEWLRDSRCVANREILRHRLQRGKKKWSVELALTTPVRRRY
jgi:hypothetical protein